jgi:(p)ppGpp synthase/HD superfamily hydrolase
MPTLQTYNTMEDIERLAEFAHFRQKDRAGYPYIKHPMRVMETVRQQGGAPYVQMAAALHDVTEDTRFTPQILLDLGVPEAAVEIVKLLDRDYSKSQASSSARLIGWTREGAPRYEDIDTDEFYYANIKASPEARMVKLADITDNTQPWRMSYMKPETQARLKAKYAKAHQLLGV